MTDPKSGLPADSLSPDGTASVQTSTTNIGAYMWSTVVADQLGIITHAEAVKRLRRTLGSLETMERDQTMERHEPERPVLQLVRPHDGREAHGLAADRRADHPRPDPVVRRQRLARDRAARRREQRARGRGARRGASSTAWTSASTTGRPSTGSPSTTRPADRQVAVLLRHDREREPDRELHRDRQGRDPGQGVLRVLADVPRHVRLELAGDASRSAFTGRTSA